MPKATKVRAPPPRKVVGPFLCSYEFCRKSFIRKGDCKRHEKIHLPPEEQEVYMFRCPLCSFKNLQNNNVTIHVNKHKGLKPFPCTECHKSYADPATLTRHKVKQHGYQPHHTEEYLRQSAPKRKRVAHKRKTKSVFRFEQGIDDVGDSDKNSSVRFSSPDPQADQLLPPLEGLSLAPGLENDQFSFPLPLPERSPSLPTMSLFSGAHGGRLTLPPPAPTAPPLSPMVYNPSPFVYHPLAPREVETNSYETMLRQPASRSPVEHPHMFPSYGIYTASPASSRRDVSSSPESEERLPLIGRSIYSVQSGTTSAHVARSPERRGHYYPPSGTDYKKYLTRYSLDSEDEMDVSDGGAYTSSTYTLSREQPTFYSRR